MTTPHETRLEDQFTAQGVTFARAWDEASQHYLWTSACGRMIAHRNTGCGTYRATLDGRVVAAAAKDLLAAMSAAAKSALAAEYRASMEAAA